MYKIQIKTSIGTVIIYLDTLLKLQQELEKYPGYEGFEATKIKKRR